MVQGAKGQDATTEGTQHLHVVCSGAGIQTIRPTFTNTCLFARIFLSIHDTPPSTKELQQFQAGRSTARSLQTLNLCCKMDLALVGALAAFFRVDTVALCFFSGDGDDEYSSWISNSSALDPFFTVPVSDHQILRDKLLVQESRLLMACDDPIFLDLSSELFGPNIVWLLPESEIINSVLLPLTL